MPLRKVEHIEQQIRELSGQEFAELRDWVLDQDWKSWDARIEADAKGGKLDKLMSEAKAAHAAGKSRPF